MTLSDENERDVFTEYIANLADDGTPPDERSYEEVLRHLCNALVRELQHRGMWAAPPAYVGIADSYWDDRALDELARDAYVFSFVRRLRGLRKQLKLKKNIRGLVIRNLRNFLTDRQKDADPIGYRVFTRLRGAVERLIESGTVVVRTDASRKTRPGNDTDLGFSPGSAIPASRDVLAAHARRWNDDLLPDLVTAQGHAVPKVVERLARRIEALANDGVAAFRFSDLVDPMKRDIRQRWADALGAELPRGPEEGVALVRAGPDSPPTRIPTFDPRKASGPGGYLRLIRCVRGAIDRLDEDRRRRELWKLWSFLCDFAESSEVTKRPSNVRLGRLIGIRRVRLPALYAELGKMVRRCQRATADEVLETNGQKIDIAEGGEDVEPCENRSAGGAR